MIGWGDIRPSTLEVLEADPRVRLSASGSWLEAEAGDES